MKKKTKRAAPIANSKGTPKRPLIKRGQLILSAIEKLEQDRKRVQPGNKDLLKLYDVQINNLHDRFDKLVHGQIGKRATK